MRTKFVYKPPDTDCGALRTPITFFESVPRKGPEPGQAEGKKLHECFAEIYKPSMKDMEIIKTVGTRESVTIRIRDPGIDYLPTNKHTFVIEDYRYTGKLFDIIDVAPDLKNNRFIKIIGGYTS